MTTPSTTGWLPGAELLPVDGVTGTLVGRAWVPDAAGPSVIVVRLSLIHI